jgi:hypothetical protein
MIATAPFVHQTNIQSCLAIAAQTMPAAAERANRALRVLLQTLYQEPDEAIAWQGSLLTGDGFPLEFAFTPADTDLRYTTEVGDPLTAPSQRLTLACQRLTQLGYPVPTDLRATLHDIQQGADLDYGAWVGGRHSPTSDSYKLYVEVPKQIAPASETVLNALQIPRPHLSDRPVPPCMIGYHLTAHRLESYFRVADANTHHLNALMSYCGLGDRTQELVDLLEESYGYRLRNKLPGGSIGVSYSLSPGGVLPIFSLFLFARVFWGSDRTIRRKAHELASRNGWDLSLYQRVTESLGDRHTCATQHGMVGFIVPPEGPIALSLGIRP